MLKLYGRVALLIDIALHRGYLSVMIRYISDMVRYLSGMIINLSARSDFTH